MGPRRAAVQHSQELNMQIVTNQLFSTLAALTISTMLFVTVLV